MIRAFKAQLLTMRNRSTILGLAIPCVGLPLGILVTFLIKNSLRNETTWTDTGVLTELLVGGSFVFGVAAIVMVARAVGTKYDYATMQVALTHQPDRARFLSGTVAAAITGVLVALAVAAVAAVAVGWVIGSIVNIDTSGFLTADSLRACCTDVLRIGAGVVGPGVIAATVAAAAPSACSCSSAGRFRASSSVKRRLVPSQGTRRRFTDTEG